MPLLHALNDADLRAVAAMVKKLRKQKRSSIATTDDDKEESDDDDDQPAKSKRRLSLSTSPPSDRKTSLVYAAQHVKEDQLSTTQRLTDDTIRFASMIINSSHDDDDYVHSYCFASLEVLSLFNSRETRKGKPLERWRLLDGGRLAMDLKSRYWLLPLHENENHWTLAVFDRAEQKLYLFDSMCTQAEKPLPSAYSRLPDFLGVDSNSVQRLKSVQQQDDVSCGLFVIEYMRIISTPGWTPGPLQSVSVDNTRQWLADNKARILGGAVEEAQASEADNVDDAMQVETEPFVRTLSSSSFGAVAIPSPAISSLISPSAAATMGLLE
jgi:hypothetical protein